MEITLAGGSIAGEDDGAAVLLLQFVGQRDAVSDAHLRPQVADHAHHAVLLAAEMEAPLASLAVAGGLALPLGEKLAEGHAPRGEHAQVAVHGQDVLLLLQHHGGTHTDGLLTDTAEPLTDLALTKQAQHLLLDDARVDQLLVGVQEKGVGVDTALIMELAVFSGQ